VLVLGRAETIPDAFRGSYEELDAREHVYRRVAVQERRSLDAHARDGQQHLAQEQQ
jgi:hypothetical protein